MLGLSEAVNHGLSGGDFMAQDPDLKSLQGTHASTRSWREPRNALRRHKTEVTQSRAFLDTLCLCQKAPLRPRIRGLYGPHVLNSDYASKKFHFSGEWLIRIRGRNLYRLSLIEIREADSDEPVNQQNQRKNGKN
jgi:hypothetical protein